MRIVAGIHRGRRLVAPDGLDVRPTADRTREAIFSKLSHGWNPDEFTLSGARVLDAFAGTGALGLEALSRGAGHVTFIEQAPASLAALRRNAETLKATADVTLTRADATAPPTAPQPCSLVLMDPPYDSGLETPALAALAAQGWIAPGAVVVVEVPRTRDPDLPDGFTLEDVRVYGKAKVAYLRYAP
jgi:16S rRNA (guanine966-N2)-methyltransferase